MLAYKSQYLGVYAMFNIKFFGLGANGEVIGPQSASCPTDNLDEAIAKAKRIMQLNTFSFGRVYSFEIYDNDGYLAYSSLA